VNDRSHGKIDRGLPGDVVGSGFSGKRLMNGSMSAMSTALPRISAAIVIETEVVGASPVPLSISTRMNATTCRATKKKIVGGRISRNSSLILADSVLMALQSCGFGIFGAGGEGHARNSLAPAMGGRTYST